MEEILASIRRIIAEEPVGTRPEPAPGHAEAGGASPTPGTASGRADESAFPLSVRNEPGLNEPPYSVEDALADLIDDTPSRRIGPAIAKEDPAPKPHTRTAAPPEQSGQRPNWLFARPGAAQVEPPADPPFGELRDTSGLLGKLDKMRPSPDGAPEVAAPKPAAPQKSSPAGTSLDQQGDGLRSATGDRALPSRAPSFQELPRTAPSRAPLPGAPGGQRGDGQAPIVPASAGSSRSDPVVAQPALRAAEPAREAKAAPTIEEVEEPAEVTSARAEQQRRDATRPEAPDVESGSPSTPIIAAAKRADASPLAELAQGLGSVVPSPAEEAVGKPESALQPEALANTPATRTLEDTVAELLRPMLRDWLDANMPRIVEKALRVELAASAKRPGTTGPR